MDVTKPYKLIGFGAMDVTKPYKFIGFQKGGADYKWFRIKPGPYREIVDVRPLRANFECLCVNRG